MRKVLVLFVIIMGVFFMQGCGDETVTADLILTNGKIYTLDENGSTAEAAAILGDSIIAVGSSVDLEKYSGENTKVVDLKGAFVMPGIIESHAHFMGIGEMKKNLNLMKAQNWDEIIYMVAEAAASARPGEWIIGRGWHQEKWNSTPRPNVQGYPVHNELSEASPRNPVILSHASGHAIFVNKTAMDIAGISKDTPDPEGGFIVRDESGNPIGVFNEEPAENLIKKYYRQYLNKRSPEEKLAGKIKTFELAVEECLVNGITSFHDAGETFKNIDFFKEMADSGRLGIRLNVMIGEPNDSLDNDKLAAYKTIGYAGNHLQVNSIKRYSDGALGNRGARMLEPYSDDTTADGENVTSISELKKTARLAAVNDYQLCIHAIGDRANREILDIYEETQRIFPAKKLERWRIEHAQILDKTDIPRFAELNVIPAVQAIHCTSDAGWVDERIGMDRAEEGAYVWRKLIDSGAVICNGTDAPVEDVDPIPNFYASVTRKYNGGEFFPEQCMTREEALKSMTVNGAYASFEENLKGTIEPGKLADFTVLSKNLMTVPDDEILSAEVLYTIVGGKILYQKNND